MQMWQAGRQMKIAAELPPEPEPLDKSPQLRLVVDDVEHAIGRDEPHEGDPRATYWQWHKKPNPRATYW